MNQAFSREVEVLFDMVFGVQGLGVGLRVVN